MSLSVLIELLMVVVIAIVSVSAGIYIWVSLLNQPEIIDEPRSLQIPNLNQDLLIGLFENYLASDPPDGFCLAGLSGSNDHGPLWLWRKERWQELSVKFKDERWVVKASGVACEGVETWQVNDVTGYIQYQGSSKIIK